MAILYCVSPTWRRHTTTFWPINGLACWTVRSRRGHRNDACKWCTVGSCSANISTQRKWMSNVRHYKCHGVLSAIFQVSRVIQFPLSPLFPLDLEDYHPSVLLHCWLGHLTCKIVSERTYNVSSGTLNPTIPYNTILKPTSWLNTEKIYLTQQRQTRIHNKINKKTKPSHDFWPGNESIYS